MTAVVNAAGLLYRTALDILIGRENAGSIPNAPRLVAFNAWPHPQLHDLVRHAKDFTLHQHRRSLALDMTAMGLTVAPPAPDDDAGETGMALVLAGGQRAQSLGWAAVGLEMLAPDGLLLFCAPNAMGARGYARRLLELAPSAIVTTRARSRLLVLRKADVRDWPEIARWREAARPQRQRDTGLWTRPGVFGWEQADAGSRLLAERLPRDLAGRGMDLGCGIGFLADRAVHANPEIEALHLVDEDALALDCARRNLSQSNRETRAAESSLRIHAHWLDATREALPDELDWVLLNPPFHAGGRRDVELGQTMVRAACESLKPGGRLLMVANRKLPYEPILNASLNRWRLLHQGGGFKVMEGIR